MASMSAATIASRRFADRERLFGHARRQRLRPAGRRGQPLPQPGGRAMSGQVERGERFRALHGGEPFVIPNPWDAGSARVLAGLGFRALATTSSGFAFTLGRSDGGATLDEVIEHTATL